MASSSVSSLPASCPKSPPVYPDLYGKRRELAKVQMLEREIGILEEELKTVQGLQPASRCCKEFYDYVGTNPDPLIPTNRKIRRSFRFWKWICGKSCFNFSWICCSCGCSLNFKMPSCCACCRPQKWRCCRWSHCCCHCFCLDKLSCRECCVLPAPSCPDCTCTRCTCSCPKCTKVCLCSNCTKSCYKSCCLCY